MSRIEAPGALGSATGALHEGKCSQTNRGIWKDKSAIREHSEQRSCLYISKAKEEEEVRKCTTGPWGVGLVPAMKCQVLPRRDSAKCFATFTWEHLVAEALPSALGVLPGRGFYSFTTDCRRPRRFPSDQTNRIPLAPEEHP